MSSTKSKIPSPTAYKAESVEHRSLARRSPAGHEHSEIRQDRKRVAAVARPKALTVRYTSHIKIAGYGRSDDGTWFVKLFVKACGSTAQAPVVRIDDFLGNHAKIRERLNRYGAHLVANQALNELIARIQARRPTRADFLVATRTGWNGSHFVLPDGVISAHPSRLEICLDRSDPEHIVKYQSSGTLAGTIELLKLARGNSRLQCALALSLLGPTARFINLPPAALQLTGDPGTGKSAMGVIASSSWGWNPDPDLASQFGFGDSWNHTANNIELILAAYQHIFLFLDETRLADVLAFLAAIMRLASGQSKGRYNELGRHSWQVSILSTSNMGLDQMAREAKVQLDDAYRDRLIDIPAPEDGDGFFEDLHGFRTKQAFIAHMKALAAQNHGVLGREFVRRLVKWEDIDSEGLVAWVRYRFEFYLKQARRITAPGRDLFRLHQKFAGIYAAGALAIRFGLFPWTWREMLNSLLSCERDHVAYVAKHATNQSSAVEVLREYIDKNAGDFIDLRQQSQLRKPYNSDALGYLDVKAGRPIYLFPSKCFDEIFGGRHAALRAKEQLFDRNLICTTTGGGARRYVVKHPMSCSLDGVPRREWVVAVWADITIPD